MPSGGKRDGAGRPKGSGRYGEPTKLMRIPESLVEQVGTLIRYKGFKLPFYLSKVQAGLPSPADDSVEDTLELTEHLIHHPASTFLVRATGDSMIGAGIYPDDLLIVDRAIAPEHGRIIIAAINGELTVKRLHKHKGKIFLMPENDQYDPIEITEDNEVIVWGVVTSAIHSF